MNAKPEQIQTGSTDAAEKKNLIAPDAAAELTEVTNEELDRVEGGPAANRERF